MRAASVASVSRLTRCPLTSKRWIGCFTVSVPLTPAPKQEEEEAGLLWHIAPSLRNDTRVAEAHGVECGVGTLLLEQVGVSTLLDDTSILQDNDDVGILDG
jgi:hypothetical protein